MTYDYNELKKTLEEPALREDIKKVLGSMMSRTVAINEITHAPALAHVDPQILEDIRNQSYSIFERASAINVLIHIVAEKQSNDFINSLLVDTFMALEKRDDSMHALLKTTVDTYAPNFFQEMEKRK